VFLWVQELDFGIYKDLQGVLGELKNMIKYVDDTGELRGEFNER
jgi:hypothetical protein